MSPALVFVLTLNRQQSKRSPVVVPFSRDCTLRALEAAAEKQLAGSTPEWAFPSPAALRGVLSQAGRDPDATLEQALQRLEEMAGEGCSWPVLEVWHEGTQVCLSRLAVAGGD